MKSMLIAWYPHGIHVHVHANVLCTLFYAILLTTQWSYDIPNLNSSKFPLFYNFSIKYYSDLIAGGGSMLGTLMASMFMSMLMCYAHSFI